MLPHCFSSKLMPRMFSRAYSATTHINYYDKYANAMIKSLPIAANSQKLNDILKLEKLECLDSSTIGEIWHSHFLQKPFKIGISMDSKLYTTWLEQRSKESPIAIVPSQHGLGLYENYLARYVYEQGNHLIYLTSLQHFHKFGEAAPVIAKIFGYSELLRTKDLGLLLIEFNGQVINREQVIKLITDCSRIYTKDDLYQWIRHLNHNPNMFNYEAFLAHMISQIKYTT